MEFAPAGSGRSYQRAFAGDSFNTAVYLARAAQSVRYLTRLGDDDSSTGALRMMTEEGIDPSLVQRQADGNMGLYLIENDDSGERSFTYYRDGSPARRLFDQPLKLSADVFYFTGITLAVTRSGRENLIRLLADLQQAGCWLVFDPNYRPRLWDGVAQAQAACADVLPFCNLVLPTLADDQALWGLGEAMESVVFYREHGAAEVVVKGDRNVIKKFRVGDTTYNVKKFKTPNAIQSLVYRFLRRISSLPTVHMGQEI